MNIQDEVDVLHFLLTQRDEMTVHVRQTDRMAREMLAATKIMRTYCVDFDRRAADAVLFQFSEERAVLVSKRNEAARAYAHQARRIARCHGSPSRGRRIEWQRRQENSLARECVAQVQAALTAD